MRGHWLEQLVLRGTIASADNVDSTDDKGCSALHYAALRNNLTDLRALLNAGASVDLQAKEGWTPLFLAAQGGHAEVIAALLKVGAAVDLQTTTGAGPLHIATEKGQMAALAALLDGGADLELHSEQAQGALTPLSHAAFFGQVEVVKVLLAAGANHSAKCRGKTAHEWALSAGHAEVALALTRWGACPGYERSGMFNSQCRHCGRPHALCKAA